MAEIPQPVSMSRARERAIEELSNHFSNDDLTLEELERRIERVYQAVSVAELDSLTADLRAAIASPPLAPLMQSSLAQPEAPARTATLSVERERILAVMGETRRRGAWSVARHIDLFAMMSDTTLDLTQARIPPGTVDIHVTAMWSAVKVIVPPGVHVVNRMSAVMASVTSDADITETYASATTRTVQLSGLALMAEVKVRVED